jgi:hypothetical protein
MTDGICKRGKNSWRNGGSGRLGARLLPYRMTARSAKPGACTAAPPKNYFFGISALSAGRRRIFPALASGE